MQLLLQKSSKIEKFPDIYCMRFLEWLQLNEIQHISLPQKMHINGILTDGIDFRFEDWRRGYRTQKGILRVPPSAPERFFNSPFSAPLENSTYLNVSYQQTPVSAFRSGGLSLAGLADKNIEISTEPLENVLPRQWFDFAVFYLGNKVVKPPEWPRHKSEEIELTAID